MMAVFVIIVLSATLLGQGKTNSEEVFPSGKIPIHQYKEDISKDGLTKTYYFHADDILKNGSTLIFHERHHDIKIYTIISMDLNNLKRVNDQQGHIDGDKYIKAAAETIKNVFGKYGKCYRIGGDEFAVILREKYKGKAPSLIKELTENINEYNINLPLDAPNRLIIAAGYSENIPNTDQNFESVLKRADEMMYKNKKEIKLAERRAGVQDDYVDPRLT